jgi:DNA polymerase-1
MPPILYLIDGHALAYRTFYALIVAGGNRFQTGSGEPTAGSFGFANSLLRILEQEHPEYLAVAFDTGKTFRSSFFPEYKATRAKMPDDLRKQMKRIQQMVDDFHFPRLEVQNYEADDVLGSIAYQAVDKGFGVKIITGDRDLLQLVNERIIVSLPGKKLSDSQDYTPKDVLEDMGIRPDQVVDFKGLVGDKSDNIPGIRGIGEKTAVTLLEKYDSLDNIYAHLDEISTRQRNLLEEGKDQAYLSQKLAQIHTDVKVSLKMDDARTTHIDFDAVKKLFDELEFSSLMKRLNTLSVSYNQPLKGQQASLFTEEMAKIGTSAGYEPKYTVIDTVESMKDLQQKLDKAEQISFDTETTSLDPMMAKLVGISIAVESGEGYYIPVGHRTGEDQLDTGFVLDALRPFFTDPKKKLIGHNLKYDGLVMAQNGLKPLKYSFDTMIAEWLRDPETRQLGLKEMADRYLSFSMTHIEELIGSGRNQLSMADVPVKKVAPYASADAIVPLELKSILEKSLQERNAIPVFQDIEMPLMAVLLDMEENGIALDVDFFKKFSSKLNERSQEIEEQIYKIAGYKFNLNSTQQLSKVLFETLKLEPPGRKKTASGFYSTSASVLEDLRGENPIVDLVLEYRELSKLQSTYVDTLPQQINPITGRVHTSYSQTGSVTGRLASSNPNLQNIPTRTEIGQQVRHGFIADPKNVLLSTDYSQIELRIVAHMSQDKAMLEAFRRGQDIHAATAAAVANIDIAQVTKDQRRHAKAINFGLIYGMSPYGLVRATDLTLGEAEDFVHAYFEKFPGVKKYLDDIRRKAAEQGYVETLLGRRRYFPNLHSRTNASQRNREEREAVNAPIQGTAADIIKIAMIRLPSTLKQKGLKAKLLLQVHDELILECPQTEMMDTAVTVRDVMENAFKLSIPLATDTRWGKNWGEMEPVNFS